MHVSLRIASSKTAQHHGFGWPQAVSALHELPSGTTVPKALAAPQMPPWLPSIVATQLDVEVSDIRPSYHAEHPKRISNITPKTLLWLSQTTVLPLTEVAH